MNKFIARLIDCGIPRLTAICICKAFKKHGDMDKLACYVDAVEQECYGDLEKI